MTYSERIHTQVHTIKRQLTDYLFHVWCVDEHKEHSSLHGAVVEPLWFRHRIQNCRLTHLQVLTAAAASKHTTAPINHTRTSPRKHSPDDATRVDIQLQLNTHVGMSHTYIWWLLICQSVLYCELHQWLRWASIWTGPSPSGSYINLTTEQWPVIYVHMLLTKYKCTLHQYMYNTNVIIFNTRVLSKCQFSQENLSPSATGFCLGSAGHAENALNCRSSDDLTFSRWLWWHWQRCRWPASVGHILPLPHCRAAELHQLTKWEHDDLPRAPTLFLHTCQSAKMSAHTEKQNITNNIRSFTRMPIQKSDKSTQ